MKQRKHPAPDALPDCVCGALRVVARAVTQSYDDVLRPSGLRVTQFSLLSRIARLGPLSATRLGAALKMDQTTLTRSLGLLEREGLIRRVASRDARLKLMTLTPAGRRRLAQTRPLWRAAQNGMVRRIGKNRWGEAQRALGKILAAL